ncbi:MAG: transglutaminase-like domain-containing protein [Candidatus Helarchaeota archaeon]
MKIQVELANTLTIQSGVLQTGYLIWSLYGESPHQSVKVLQQVPPFSIREMGEKNFGGYIKLPTLKAGDEFHFQATLLFSTKTIKFPILNFKFEQYHPTLIAQYCRAAKFWEKNDPELIEIAHKLRTQSKNDVLKCLRLTFDFVQEHIKFRENLDHRLGARIALKQGKGDCDEFSDLFITLCRINQIPARRVLGIILISDTKFNLHAWAEIFIPIYKQWVPFDVALGEFASIKWNYLLRAHSGLQNEIPLVRFKSKVGKNFRAKFEDNDVLQISLLKISEN